MHQATSITRPVPKDRCLMDSKLIRLRAVALELLSLWKQKHASYRAGRPGAICIFSKVPREHRGLVLVGILLVVKLVKAGVTNMISYCCKPVCLTLCRLSLHELWIGTIKWVGQFHESTILWILLKFGPTLVRAKIQEMKELWDKKLPRTVKLSNIPSPQVQDERHRCSNNNNS